MKEIRHNWSVRKGSVLLQTLVMCMVLSYIAVTLTQWILARHTSSSELRNTMELGSMAYDAPSYAISQALSGCLSGDNSSCPATTASESWTQYRLTYNTDGSFQQGVLLATPEANAKWSEFNIVRKKIAKYK